MAFPRGLRVTAYRRRDKPGQHGKLPSRLWDRVLISMTVLLWLREIQQLCVVANLKRSGFQAFNLFL